MPSSLTLLDFSDSDLYWAWADAQDAEGWASAGYVARQIGISHKHPAKCVGSRFAWFKRYGWFENKRSGKEMVWRPTEKGVVLFEAKLAAGVANALAGLDEGKRAQAISELAAAIPGSSREAAHLALRAFRNRTGAWRDPRLARKEG